MSGFVGERKNQIDREDGCREEYTKEKRKMGMGKMEIKEREANSEFSERKSNKRVEKECWHWM